MILQKVDVLEQISKKDFQDNYFKKHKPLLLKGFAKQWNAYEKWNLDYIREKAGEQIVPIYNNQPADANKSSDSAFTKMKMKDYIDAIKTQPSDLRIFFYIITDKLPELLKDFSYPDLGMKFFKRLPTLFFGGSKAHVLMHYDVDLGDFIHVHFGGKKRILLFDQKQSALLYKVPLSVHTIEEIDFDHPDYEKYPALQLAEGHEILMEHGDAVFIPGAFWHYNRYLEPGFSLSLRALPSRPSTFLSMMYHVFIMRYTDKLMRKIFKKKWIDYKEKWAYKKSTKAFSKRNTTKN